MKKIIFYGGTGQAKVMRPIADKIGKLVAVLDDTPNLTAPFGDVELYSGPECFEEWHSNRESDDYYFAITIGNPHSDARQYKASFLEHHGLNPINLIHESAIIDPTVELGRGIQIHAGVIVSPHVRVGDFCILNTRSVVEHDCVLNDAVEVGPGAVLCGNVSAQTGAWIGASSVVRQKINIGPHTIVGAGAAVVKDVAAHQIVVGTPARPLSKERLR